MIIKYKTLNFSVIFCTAFCMIFVISETFAQAPGSATSSNKALFEEAVTVSTDVCPEPKSSLSKTPNDLAQIQSDITRFSLCVKRAQLLERLNDLVSGSIETIDSAIEYNVPQSLDYLSESIMRNVPVPASPSVDVINSNDNIVPIQPVQNQWYVRDIGGMNSSLNATLSNDEGVVMNVKQGEKLPDNAGVVSSLSVSGVKIKKNGKVTTLKWAE